MTEGRRPGGLTALAVLNFVFGGINVLFVFGLVAMLAVVDETTSGALSEEMRKQKIEPSFIYAMIAISLVISALMIVSGVGYLGMKRVLGRTMGNTFSIISIGYTIFSVMVQGFNIGTVFGLIYPVLTLVLLNTTFKDDLVH